MRNAGLGRRAWSGEGVSSVAYVAGEEGILDIVLCREERDGRRVRVIVLACQILLHYEKR